MKQIEERKTRFKSVRSECKLLNLLLCPDEGPFARNFQSCCIVWVESGTLLLFGQNITY